MVPNARRRGPARRYLLMSVGLLADPAGEGAGYARLFVESLQGVAGGGRLGARPAAQLPSRDGAGGDVFAGVRGIRPSLDRLQRLVGAFRLAAATSGYFSPVGLLPSEVASRAFLGPAPYVFLRLGVKAGERRDRGIVRNPSTYCLQIHFSQDPRGGGFPLGSGAALPLLGRDLTKAFAGNPAGHGEKAGRSEKVQRRHALSIPELGPRLKGPRVMGQPSRGGVSYAGAWAWTCVDWVPILTLVAFRDRLVETIRAAGPVLETEGVLVVGSEVPNLLEPGAAATLTVSQDLNVGVPVDRHAAVKRRLGDLRAFEPSADEPSVWTPRSPDLLELNFVGMDPAQDPAEAYVLEDDRLPLLVFGALSLVVAGARIDVEGTRLSLLRPAGLLLEKLITDRTGEKGERDLLVALALLATAGPRDLDELEQAYRRLRPELRHAVRSNLTILSLLAPWDGMPDPRPWRAEVAVLMRRLEAVDSGFA